MAYCSLKGSVSGTRIVFDQIEDINFDERATVPEYPTEAGFKVSDAVQKSLPALSVSGMISAHSLMDGGAQNINALETIIYNLRELYKTSEICTFYQYTEKSYGNLIIESLSIQKSTEVKDAYTIDLELKQMSFPVATIAKFYTTEEAYKKAMIEQMGPAAWIDMLAPADSPANWPYGPFLDEYGPYLDEKDIEIDEAGRTRRRMEE